MVKPSFTSVNDVVFSLKNKYSAFNSDINYYNKIVGKFSDLSFEEQFVEAEKSILTDPSLNLDALLLFLEKGLFKEDNYLAALDALGKNLEEWEIEIDIDMLQTLINKSTLIANAFKSIVDSMDKKEISSIEKLSVCKSCRELLINYFLLKDYININELVFQEAAAKRETGDIYSDNSTDIYIKEISRIPVLSAEKQALLGKMVQMGNMEAKKELIEHNLSLVVFFSKKYLGRGLELNDLIQAGNEGLIIAAGRYNPEKGYKFSPYAAYWIRKKITNAVLEDVRTIRVPIHAGEFINQINKTRKKLTNLLGYEPSLEEIAQEMGVSLERLKLYDNIPEVTWSIDSKIRDEDENKIKDEIFDEEMLTPEEQVLRDSLVASVDSAFALLTKRQALVLRLRFAIQDRDNPRKEFERINSLDEVAKMLNVTREGIRQAERKALLRLRRPAAFKKIESYYEGSLSRMPLTSTKVGKSDEESEYLNDDYTIDINGVSELQESAKKSSDYHVPRKLNKLLIERLGCTEDEYILIKKYIKNSKVQSFKTLFIVHGSDLNKDLPVNVLSPEQKEIYYRAIYVLKERLIKIRKIGAQKLQTVLGVNDSDFVLATQFLRNFDSEKIMEFVFGKDFQDEGNIAILNPVQERMYYNMLKQIKNYINMQRKTVNLQNAINCPDDIWPNIRDYILQREAFCKLFIPIFGSDLSVGVEISHINTSQKNDLASAIKDIRKVISGYLRYVGKDLATIACLNESEEGIVYTLLCDNSELAALFGSDFSFPLSGNSYLEKGRENIRELLDIVLEAKRRFRRQKKLQQYSEPIDNIYINGINIANYDRMLLNQALKLVPIKYQGILSLHLGFGGDEIFYPSEKLAIIFNKNVTDIESDILHGKVYLEELIEACKKAYERGLENIDSEELKRIRNMQN